MFSAIARRLSPSSRGSESGIALLIVIGVGMVMLILVATGLTIAINGLRKTDTDQDWNGALDAAFAGVEEYQSRLATDNSYYTYGNKDAPFSVLTGSTKLTLPTGTAANPAFGIDTSGTWALVPGSTPVASFRYEVDNSRYSTSGGIRIRATGRVGAVTRSIVADLKQSGFIDYLYFTDYEVQDPDLTGKTQCAVHIWENRPWSCDVIRFGASDVIDGPVHSNDTITICQTTFNGKVTTSNPGTPIVSTPSGCSAATYSVNPSPVYQPAITMPPTNAQLKKETRNDLTASEVPLPGCLYTGPTVVTFTSDGKMNVKSPWTIKTNISETSGISSSAPAACGTPGTASGALGSVTGATIDTLPANVMYVQNVPTITTDPNYSASAPANFVCVNSNAGWTFGSAATTLTQYPVANEITPDGSTATKPAYGCKNGDVFVKGTFKGAMTVASEHYVYITGDLTYADASKDILGLVGNGAVWVWNPMKTVTSGSGGSATTVTRPLLTDSGRTIQAAIISVAHTFQVQNYNQGELARGTLTVKGSIAQMFRGPVGLVGGSGYIKAYKYDTRLAYLAPPKFLSPVSSSYGVSQFASVPSAFGVTGAALP
jgi:Tfp pilus assembly protein PilX